MSLSYYYLKSHFSKIFIVFFVENLISILILNFFIPSLFEIYDVYGLSPISFSIMKIGLLILLFILENVDNRELQFITHGCRRSKHKCDKIS